MNEALELQIKRLEFCRDCIVLDYDAGREEYNYGAQYKMWHE